MKILRWLKSPNALTMLWVGLCFALTSSVYLSWLNHLVLLTGALVSDWISMVAGYFCQGAGTGLVSFFLHRKNAPQLKTVFFCTICLFAAFTVPVLVTHSAAGVVFFGLVMNFLCGVMAGCYLSEISAHSDQGHAGFVFGGGYATATVATGLLALIGHGHFLHSKAVLLLYLPLACALACLTSHMHFFQPAEEDHSVSAKSTSMKSGTVILACIAVFLISLVKNLGFGFPAADIEAGLIPELTRLPYAIGLIAAGFICDKSRRNGMLCTIGALIIPFLMLGLVGEPVSRTFFWGLDYIFYGFFSVFRVILFLDLAREVHIPSLAPFGLVIGRLGDAWGTSLCILLTGSRIALILLSVVLFFLSVFLLFAVYQRLYEPEPAQQRSEKEIFITFCQHNDLSDRERDVFQMIISNHTNGEIAEALFISENTVKFHVRNVLQKTGCKNRNELKKKYLLLLYPNMEKEDVSCSVV